MIQYLIKCDFLLMVRGFDGIGKQRASGTGTFVSNSNYIDVTGLTFQPKTIIAQFEYLVGGYMYFCIYSSELSGFALNNILFDLYHSGTSITGFNNITETGFRFTDSSHTNWNGVTTNFKWWALA